jgi:hypothetical protein
VQVVTDVEPQLLEDSFDCRGVNAVFPDVWGLRFIAFGRVATEVADVQDPGGVTPRPEVLLVDALP